MAALTEAQRERLGILLDQQRSALLEEIRNELLASDVQHFRDLAGRVTDVGDEAVADALADLNAAMIDRHVQALRAIEAAQARLAQGDVGVCIDCGADIGWARLEAQPTAQRCIQCQTTHEKTYAHEGHPSL